MGFFLKQEEMELHIPFPMFPVIIQEKKKTTCVCIYTYMYMSYNYYIYSKTIHKVTN